jgi:hypothetical protein
VGIRVPSNLDIPDELHVHWLSQCHPPGPLRGPLSPYHETGPTSADPRRNTGAQSSFWISWGGNAWPPPYGVEDHFLYPAICRGCLHGLLRLSPSSNYGVEALINAAAAAAVPPDRVANLGSDGLDTLL